MSSARSLWGAAGSLVAVFVGSFGPWASKFGLNLDGSDDEFIGIAALVAAVSLCVFALTRNRMLAAVPLLVGLVSAAVIGHDLTDPAGPFGGPGPNIRLEWGIWTALAGSIGLALASIWLFFAAASRTARADGAPSLGIRAHRRSAIPVPTRTRPAHRRLSLPVSTRRLGTNTDDAVVKDVARRLNRPGVQGANFLVKLVDQMHGKAVGSVLEQLTPVREVDYARHRIELLVSSPAIVKRLGPVEKEPFTVDWIERSIKPGDVFYDIGANVGSYSLIAAKVTGNAARVFAFEPAPASFHDLSRNVLLNGCAESVVPLPLALWSKTGLMSFTFRSLSAGASRHRISHEVGAEKPLTETILGVRLDDLVERFGLPVPTHAKIDVDGYELEVLRGAKLTLLRPEWRSIIVELDPEETERNRAVKALLANAGFDHAVRHGRESSRRYPHPERRPDVYWTFARSVTQENPGSTGTQLP